MSRGQIRRRAVVLVVLYEPEIPPNTGNIARLCAAFGVELHLVEPLGFKLENRYLKRAGLDYWPNVKLHVWPGWEAFLERAATGRRLVLATTKTNILLPSFSFLPDDALVFGPETRGLPAEALSQSPWHVRIPIRPMKDGGVRSLNLATAAGIVLYTALADCGMLEL